MYQQESVEEDELQANVIVRSNRNDNLSIQLHDSNLKDVDPVALIDSGAQGRFVDESVVAHGRRRALKRAIIVKNVDGTRNAAGTITQETRVKYRIGKQEFDEWFLITQLGDQQLILGMPWLQDHNPNIDWRYRTIELIDWSQEQGRSLREITQVIETIRREEPWKVIDNTEVHLRRMTAALIDHEDTWARAKELANYMEEDSNSKEDERVAIHGIEEDVTWVRLKQSTSQRFAQQGESKKNIGAKRMEIPPEYSQFKCIFEKKKSERLPEHQPWDHAIELKPDLKEKLKKKKTVTYPLPPKLEPVFNDWLDENLRKGYIRPSNSEFAAGLFFVGKKQEGDYRACQDYRDLNEATVKDKYPLPLVPDLLLKLQGSRYFTKLDLRWGYNNVRIRKGDEKYAAFKTIRGLYEPTVMFFGLCNSPATFQRMMNEHFKDMIDEKWIVIYMDDILICAKTRKELEERTRRVLQRLMDKDLFLKPEKCKFAQTEVEFLGLIISEGQVRMDAAKLAGIKTWPAPESVKQVRSFLGFSNFYRKFIGHYAEITKPLTNLTKKDVPFAWTDECQKAFDELKERFLEEPILKMPDTTKQFILETDASKWATGAVIKQIGEDGEMHPCGFISHTLTPPERNYQIYDRELLAVVRAIETWRYLLLGSPHPVIIHCDHKNLGFYKQTNRVTPRQARWLSLLQPYDLLWEYIP